MRESFGGAFMIKLVLVFIVIFITFMGVAVEYAKVFRLKNSVINILEENQFALDDQATIDKVDDYLKHVPYNKSALSQTECQDGGNSKFTERGVCIQEIASTATSAHFRVIAYISIDFPFFGIHMTIPVSGETKTIRY